MYFLITTPVNDIMCDPVAECSKCDDAAATDSDIDIPENPDDYDRIPVPDDYFKYAAAAKKDGNFSLYMLEVRHWA
jgi:hypothetical protein